MSKINTPDTDKNEFRSYTIHDTEVFLCAKPRISLHITHRIEIGLGYIHESGNFICRADMGDVHVVLAGPFRDPQRFLKGIIIVFDVLLEQRRIRAIPV